MIILTMTSGEFAGQSRRILMDASPLEILVSAVRHGDHWSVDYSSATSEEFIQWSMADIACRAMLAEKEGRFLFFDGCKYDSLQDWESAVSSSGQVITLDRDDEVGFGVRSIGPEPKM